MSKDKKDNITPRLSVDEVKSLDNVDILELCETTRVAILAHEGFNWLTPPPEKTLENFWKGVFIIPERTLIIARMDGQIAGCCQLVQPAKNNENAMLASTMHLCLGIIIQRIWIKNDFISCY